MGIPRRRAAVQDLLWVGPGTRAAGDAPDPYDGVFSGRVFFGEMCVGFVRLLELDADGQVALDVPVGHLPGVTGWARGPGGYLFAATYGACESHVDASAAQLWRVELDRPR